MMWTDRHSGGEQWQDNKCDGNTDKRQQLATITFHTKYVCSLNFLARSRVSFDAGKQYEKMLLQFRPGPRTILAQICRWCNTGEKSL